LAEIIGEALNLGVNTKGVEQEYKEMINRFGSEFKILVEVSEAELRAGAKPVVAEGILRMRQGKVKIEPGYDGEYGKIKIFGDGEQEEFSKQKTLF